jgi:hypothetical protein
MLDRKAILAAQDVDTSVVSVPQWGGDVHIKSISVSEAEKIGMMIANDAVGDSSIMAIWVACCACDDKGKLLFTFDDIPALSRKSKAAVQTVYTAISDLNGLDLEEATKN